MRIAYDITALIGHTPLVQLKPHPASQKVVLLNCGETRV